MFILSFHIHPKWLRRLWYKRLNLQMTLNWVRFWPFNDRRWPRSVQPPSSTSQLQQWCALPAGGPLEGYNAGRESWMLTCRKMNRQIVEMHCLLNWCLLQLANLRSDRNMFLCTTWCGDLQISFWNWNRSITLLKICRPKIIPATIIYTPPCSPSKYHCQLVESRDILKS